LVLEWSTAFLATLMAPVLSHVTGAWEHSTKVTQCVCDPKQLWATTSGSNILSFCGRLGYIRLFARRPRKKWRYEKLASTQSWFSIDSTPRKVGIWKTKKQKERGRRVPKIELKSVSKIPEDLLDGQPMWSPRWCLKTSAQTHKKLDVRPHHRQVQEGAACSGIPSGPRAFRPHPIKSCSHTHRCW
jgi:hypothetical protein